MYHYAEPVQNTSGDILPGYFARVIDKVSSAVVPIYADASSTPISTISGVTNMAKTDDSGILSFYIAEGSYHLDLYGTDATTFIKRYPDTPMGDATAAANAAAAAASATAAAGSATAASGSATSADGSAATATTQASNAAGSASTAATARDAAIIASGITGSYPNSAASNVPRGLTQASVGAITAGSGGTNGTFALAWSSGNFAINPTGTFTVAGGALTAVTITGPGEYIGASPTVPTPSFAASSGLSGAAVALTAQFLVASGQGYWVQSSDNTQLLHYVNSSGTATADTSVGPVPIVINLPLPNGTRQRWLDLVSAAGSSASSTVQAAAVELESQLRSSGLLPKIVRLNMRWGNGAAAARIPFVQRAGCGFVSDTGTIGSWTEATGLTGATIDTGVTLQQFNGSGYNLGFGFMSPTELGNGNSLLLMGNTSISWGLFSTVQNTFEAFFNTFDSNSRIEAQRQRDVGGGGNGASFTITTAGFIFGSRLPSGNGFIAYNGYGLPGATLTRDPNLSAAYPTDSVHIYTSTMTSWGDVITEGLTQSEAAMLYNIMKQANQAIGRVFVAEGAYN